jgi:4-amino-4-deoxy-L-arabinose transferase-like glycosyltransferase
MLLHVFTNGNYGMFRDEFYYIACSDHLAWGYVDHPPLSLLLLKLSRFALGDSVQAVRLLATLSGGALVFMTGLLARELGANRFGQTLAALCMAISPMHLGITGIFSMNTFDFLFWAAAFYVVVRLVKTENGKLWLVLGLVLGLGLQNKISVLFFAFSLVVGMSFTPLRRYFRDRYFWLGGGVALLLFLPYILWQIAHGWPTLEFMRIATEHKITQMSPWQFFAGQFLELHPFNFPIWFLGLVVLLFIPKYKSFRILGLIYVIAFVAFALQTSKVYYLSPAYPPLFAAGGVAIERLLQRGLMKWLKPVVLAVLLAAGASSAPLAVPVLPVESFLRYQEKLGLEPVAGERHQMGVLPQHYADRFGWPEMAAAVAGVYGNLPPEQQTDCTILGGNYGEAGALSYYGRQLELPPAVSGHNSYYHWGPGDASGNVVISVGIPVEYLAEMFDIVSPAAQIESPYAMPYESNLTVYLCLGLKVPLQEVWSRIRHYT